MLVAEEMRFPQIPRAPLTKSGYLSAGFVGQGTSSESCASVFPSCTKTTVCSTFQVACVQFHRQSQEIMSFHVAVRI